MKKIINKEGSKFKKWLGRVLKTILVFGMAGIFALAGLFVYYAKDLPDPSKINKRIVFESTKIFDRTGEHLLYEIHGEEKRTVIAASEIPDTVKTATITLEDQLFWKHHGVDFRGILRSALKDVLKGGLAQGGSTITQQFVKNSILTSEKKFSRKIKEIILALEIEQKFSKEEILQMYLNEIPYGSNAYGIEAAAMTFFGKHARELTLAQSALLACLPNAPSYYSPFGSHKDKLLARWQYVLTKMAELGYITTDQAEEAKKEDILSQIKPFRSDIKAPHFVMYIKEQLTDSFGDKEIEQNGLKVYTTLDWDLQQLAEKAVREGVEKNGPKYRFSNASLVAINPTSGHILAMVGSKDYFDDEIDGKVNVALRPRQPGSSFKPYVYAEAFEKGFTPDTILYDVETNFSTEQGKEYIPHNYDGSTRGPVKMKEALPMSLNIPAVKTLYLAGLKDSIKLAKKMGITTLNNPDNYGLSLVLGGGEVLLLDHTAAFGVFANKGIKKEKKSILRIENAQGKLIKNFEDSKGEEVLSKNTALTICQILSDNKLRAPVFGEKNALVIPDRQVFGKTGTTNEWRDGWLVGGTPSLVAGVWAGNNDNTTMARGADGSYVAGPIWNQFMSEVLKNRQKEEFEKPEERGKTGKPILDGEISFKNKIDVCKYDDGKYCLANEHCPENKREEKTFYNGHSILYYINKDDPLGDAPQNPEDDPQFKNWEKGVRKWAENQREGKRIKEMPTRECREEDF